MIEVWKEYRLVNDDNCSLLEEEDDVSKFYYWEDGELRTLENVTVSCIYDEMIVLDSEEGEYEVYIDNIESWEL